MSHKKHHNFSIRQIRQELSPHTLHTLKYAGIGAGIGILAVLVAMVFGDDEE